MAVRNSITVAVVAATVLVFLSTVISWLIVRNNIQSSGRIGRCQFLPMALPHIMLDCIDVCVSHGQSRIYGTIWIIVVAYVTTYLTYGTRLLNSTMFQIHKELEEVAQVSGASSPGFSEPS